MGFRNIFIQNPAKISVRNSQLIIKSEDEFSIPVEDISSVMIENKQSIITTAALSAMGQSGCTVFFCDEKHLPCAVLQPYMQHSRGLKVLKSQLEASEPFNKQLWKAVIQQKIRNQSSCLKSVGKEAESMYLLQLIDKIQSGDRLNVEATAAAKYFPALFGEQFTRDSEERIENSFLNYGYAVIRGNIARCIASYGLLPEKGMHHRSELNRFNLADDLIEPYRPIVDFFISSELNQEKELRATVKSKIFNILNIDTLIDGKKFPVSYAIEMTVQSLAKSYKEKQNSLQLPDLTLIRQHSYE